MFEVNKYNPIATSKIANEYILFKEPTDFKTSGSRDLFYRVSLRVPLRSLQRSKTNEFTHKFSVQGSLQYLSSTCKFKSKLDSQFTPNLTRIRSKRCE